MAACDVIAGAAATIMTVRACLLYTSGISFYTFQAISYLTDVYRKDICFEPSLINFGMYICMFPQLIAGPIVTYASVRKQISARRHSLLHLENGLREFTIGLGLKVLLANQIGGLWNDVKAIGYESISTPLAWLGQMCIRDSTSPRRELNRRYLSPLWILPILLLPESEHSRD